ncbi:NmrA family NAD(P)-binding protein [Salinigranum marinum]|uniref:NmrA family NAD(P)-binding protein n=1 Tax=Salinigranum marinum TaxID=1515595 RepID=UPI002989D377|nr:NmrA family NAD(P)-binding protein [Salinigranum marinum]
MVAKRVLVTGATGQQGGAVVDALRSGEYGEYAVYGTTRDAGSDAAAALDRDVRVVHVDVEAYRAEGGDEMADMYRWFNEGGYDVDVPVSSSRIGIDYVTFADYLDAHWASRPASPAA